MNDSSNVIVLHNSKVTDAAGNAGVGSTSSSNYRVMPAVAPAAVPTLSSWLQLLLALSLCVVALRVVGC